jgi:hypothetical protein
MGEALYVWVADIKSILSLLIKPEKEPFNMAWGVEITIEGYIVSISLQNNLTVLLQTSDIIG